MSRKLGVPGIAEPFRGLVSLPVADLVDRLDGRSTAEVELKLGIERYHRSQRAPGYAYLRVIAVEVSLGRKTIRWFGLETGFPSDPGDTASPAFIATCLDVARDGHEVLADAIEAWIEATP